MGKIKIENANPEQRIQIKKECIENAKKLAKQAHVQFDEGNYNLAIFLAITAYEESLKFGLFNSLDSGLITEKRFNQVWSSHKLKLLSKFASIRVYESTNEEVIQEYHIPEDSESLTQVTREILDKRENSLYVGLVGSALNIPSKTNPANAVEEINRADSSIANEIKLEILLSQLKKHFRTVKN